MKNLKKSFFAIVIIIPYTSFGMEDSTWDSETYDKHSSSQEITALNLIEKARRLRSIPEDADIIDIGCGTGNVTAKLAEMVPDGTVFGIDRSKDNIELAREKHLRNQHDNLTFSELKAQELNLVLGNYDIALCASVLHFIPADEQLKVLQGIHNKLKSGGCLLLLDGKCCQEELPYSALFGMVKEREWLIKLAQSEDEEALASLKKELNAVTKNYPSLEQLQTMINDAGFEGEVSSDHHIYRYENKEALMGYFRGPFSAYPRFANMEKEDQHGLIEAIADRYMEEAGVTEDELDFHLPLLTVIATKPCVE